MKNFLISKYHQHQYFYNQQNNETPIHLFQFHLNNKLQNVLKYFPNTLEMHLIQNFFFDLIDF